jgi:hypothetical protein
MVIVRLLSVNALSFARNVAGTASGATLAYDASTARSTRHRVHKV